MCAVYGFNRVLSNDYLLTMCALFYVYMVALMVLTQQAACPRKYTIIFLIQSRFLLFISIDSRVFSLQRTLFLQLLQLILLFLFLLSFCLFVHFRSPKSKCVVRAPRTHSTTAPTIKKRFLNKSSIFFLFALTRPYFCF